MTTHDELNCTPQDPCAECRDVYARMRIPFSKLNRYKVRLEHKGEQTIHSEKNIHELADELQAQGGGGYVYDEHTIIPVRRIMSVYLERPADQDHT